MRHAWLICIAATLAAQTYEVDIDGKPALINTSGQVIFQIDRGMDDWGAGFGEWSEGVTPFRRGGQTGYVDDQGRILIEPQFDRGSSFRDGFASVERNGKVQIIRKSGRVAPIAIPSSMNYYGYDEGYFLIQDFAKGEAHYIDTNGVKAFTLKGVTDNTYPFSEGLALFSMDKAEGRFFGYVDKKGSIVIPPKFAMAYSFQEGLASAKYEMMGHWHFIDKTGKMVFNAKSLAVGAFSEKLVLVVREDGTNVFVDKQGQPKIVLPRGRQSFSFFEGRALVNEGGERLNESFKDGVNGYIDKSGQLIIPLQFEYATPFKNGLARARARHDDGTVEDGYINTNGQFVWKKDSPKKEEKKSDTKLPVVTFDQARMMVITGNLTKLKSAVGSIRSQINQRDKNGMTLLSLAAFQGKLEIVKLLIDNGADVNGTNADGSTAADQANAGGHTAVADYLKTLEDE